MTLKLRSALGWAVILGLCAGSSRHLSAQTVASEAAQVVVLFNTQEPRSKEVATFYAQQRGIPSTHVIGLACGSPNGLSRENYQKQVEAPLRSELQSRGLVKFELRSGSPGASNPRPDYRATESKIRYLVLAYGMPYHIVNDPQWSEPGIEALAPQLRNNGASLEADLMLLPSGNQFAIAGPANNPYLAATNAAAVQVTNGVFLVSRLDGPTPEIAMGLVSKAIQAERDGLWGRAYFDLRGVQDPALKVGDDLLMGAVNVGRALGFETSIDTASATLPLGFPLSDVAIYAGWYDGDASGPFTEPKVDFVPGAIAYHIFSFSAADIRSEQKFWVGPLLAKGAAVTMGCVDEPFLQMTPNIGLFLARLGSGFNVAEAFAVSTPVLSWQNLVIGDPLYRPFRPNLLQRGPEMERTNSPLVPWMFVQTLNFQMNQGRPIDQAVQVLELTPATTNNPILGEKLARLYADKSRLAQAIVAAQRALAVSTNPPQRVRILLDVAEWQRTLDRPKDAYATLSQFAKEFPSHPKLLAVRREQLDYAKDLDLAQDIPVLQAEIDRLAAASRP